MVYPTKDYGTAVGEIAVALSSIGEVSGVEVRMTSEEITARIMVGSAGVRKELKRRENGLKANPHRRSKQRYGMVECDGEVHSVKEWAEILGVRCNTITARMRTHGNPKGRKGPTNEDAARMS